MHQVISAAIIIILSSLPRLYSLNEQQAPVSTDGVIVFYQPWEQRVAQLNLEIIVDQQSITYLQNSQYFKLIVSPGSHIIFITHAPFIGEIKMMSEHDAIKINVESGEILYFELTIAPGVPYPIIKKIEKADAEMVIKSLMLKTK
jgi:hypothetical protein